MYWGYMYVHDETMPVFNAAVYLKARWKGA